MTAPTPWFYTVEAITGKGRCILHDDSGKLIGLVDDEDVAKLIIHAVNTVPQLHINQIIKEGP